ncbi:MAG: c-type cytochrome [Bacteroidetes bacterium]|nr:c-type cytochrome [Bacteroidota bacterium]
MHARFLLTAVMAATIAVSSFISCNNNQSGTTSENKNDSAKQLLERGEYIATKAAVCIDCHSQRDTTLFSMPVIPGTEGGGAGFAFTKAEAVPGVLWAPNITPYALKDRTDEEIIKTLTTGINTKGDTLFPIMPYHSYGRLTKYDLQAVVAYIRTLKPIERTVPERKFFIPAAMFGPLPAANIENNTMPDPSDKVKYGQYMVTMAACTECHTPMGPQGPDFSKVFSGGFVFDNAVLKVAVPNITPDSATGIGSWSEETFVNKFRANATPEVLQTKPGRRNTFMPWSMYGKMKEEDLRAIYAYLRTVKPIVNKVEKYPE